MWGEPRVRAEEQPGVTDASWGQEAVRWGRVGMGRWCRVRGRGVHLEGALHLTEVSKSVQLHACAEKLGCNALHQIFY